MTTYNVAACALNQTALDWDKNFENLKLALEEARAAELRFVCFPELCISGYGCEDAFWSPDVQRLSLQVLTELLPHTIGLACSIGLPLLVDGALYSAAAVCANGRLYGCSLKRYLAGDDVYFEPRWTGRADQGELALGDGRVNYERRWFRPWAAGARSLIEYQGQKVPVGDLVYSFGGITLGLEICEEAWVTDRPAKRLSTEGVGIILNPSASHFTLGKVQRRREMISAASRDFNAVYLYANLLGNDSGRLIFDGHAEVAENGISKSCAPRLSFRERSWALAALELPTAKESARRDVECPSFEPSRTIVAVSRSAAWETKGELRYEELCHAEALGLFDYMRKSRSNGFVVSLSGGADSATVSYLSALAFRFAEAELGLDGVALRTSAPVASSLDELVRSNLTCVYQATENSSETTKVAAETLASALGATFLAFDVDPIVKQYLGLLASAPTNVGLPSHLTWSEHDVPLQNIQTRVRGPSVWMIANIRNALLLATSNRSEAAVGYATMDGDTCGGLSPIAGLDKVFIRKFLRWAETTGPLGFGPFGPLRAVNVLEPTAELRPPSAQQTDEGDLMPYDVLDAIERAFLVRRMSPAQIAEELPRTFPGHPSHQLNEWVERFFTLWSRNQWKRERYAPAFHLDEESLDPKSWLRFPILSGGFRRELREMRARIPKSPPGGGQR